MGVHCVVIGKIEIASGCVIGAGAVVTKSTEQNSVYAGVPARKIRNVIPFEFAGL